MRQRRQLRGAAVTLVDADSSSTGGEMTERERARSHSAARSRRSTTIARRCTNVAVLATAAAALAVRADAQVSQQPTPLAGVCPSSATADRSDRDDADRQQHTKWRAWTTDGCAVNCAVAAHSDASTGAVCAYWDTTSLSDAQRQNAVSSCWSSAQRRAAADASNASPCLDTGACLVEFMRAQSASIRSDEWTLRLGDANTSALDPVRVGELALPAQVSSLTFDGRSPSTGATATAVRFTTDLASAASLRSLLFIGLDVSASTLPSFPSSLRELYIEDCTLSKLPLARVAQLSQLKALALHRNVVVTGTSDSRQQQPPPVLSFAQFAFLQSRLVRNGDLVDTNRDDRELTECAGASHRASLGGLTVCVVDSSNGDGDDDDAVASQRRLVTADASNARSLRRLAANATATPAPSASSSSSKPRTTMQSVYVLASFAAPALYFLYKLGLYLYFSSTYSKHVHTQQQESQQHGEGAVPSKASSSTQNGDLDDDLDGDRRTTAHASSAAPDSLVLAAADPHRRTNVGFWVDEELQAWRMDFRQIKMHTCLTTTPNQRRHVRNSGSDTSAGSANFRGCEVWLGTFYPQGAPDAAQPVALKWLPPSRTSASASASDTLASSPSNAAAAIKFKGEIKRLAQLSHPNVVKFFGLVWSVDTHLVAVTEFMARGDLRQWLHRSAMRDAGRWSPRKVQLLLDIARALMYLHAQRPAALAHGNCNSRNVLLSDRLRAKLSDFGTSATRDALSERELLAYSAVGSGRWISPEALVGGRDSRSTGTSADTGADSRTSGPIGSSTTAFTGAADVYSFGILMTEMDTHALPFADLMQANRAALPESDVLQLIARGALSPTLTPTCPPAIANLVARCTAFSPTHRPASRDVVHELQELLDAMTADAAASVNSGSSMDSDSDDGRVPALAVSRGVVV